MASSTNAAEATPVTDPIPLDKESEDMEGLVQQLEAMKAKNEKIAQRKKEQEEVKHLKDAKEEKEQQEAEAKWKANEAEAKRIADEARAKQKAKWVCNAKEAHKRKVSTIQMFLVLG